MAEIPKLRLNIQAGGVPNIPTSTGKAEAAAIQAQYGAIAGGLQAATEVERFRRVRNEKALAREKEAEFLQYSLDPKHAEEFKANNKGSMEGYGKHMMDKLEKERLRLSKDFSVPEVEDAFTNQVMKQQSRTFLQAHSQEVSDSRLKYKDSLDLDDANKTQQLMQLPTDPNGNAEFEYELAQRGLMYAKDLEDGMLSQAEVQERLDQFVDVARYSRVRQLAENGRIAEAKYMASNKGNFSNQKAAKAAMKLANDGRSTYLQKTNQRLAGEERAYKIQKDRINRQVFKSATDLDVKLMKGEISPADHQQGYSQLIIENKDYVNPNEVRRWKNSTEEEYAAAFDARSLEIVNDPNATVESLQSGIAEMSAEIYNKGNTPSLRIKLAKHVGRINSRMEKLADENLEVTEQKYFSKAKKLIKDELRTKYTKRNGMDYLQDLARQEDGAPIEKVKKAYWKMILKDTDKNLDKKYKTLSSSLVGLSEIDAADMISKAKSVEEAEKEVLKFMSTKEFTKDFKDTFSIFTWDDTIEEAKKKKQDQVREYVRDIFEIRKVRDKESEALGKGITGGN